MRLHPGPDAAPARWLLEEMRVPYELAAEPLPGVLVEEAGVRLGEWPAALLYLADRWPDRGLAPAVGGPGRAWYYRWMVHAMVELDPPVRRLIAPGTGLLGADPAWLEAHARWRAAVQVLAVALVDREWLMGDAFSAADVAAAAVLERAHGAGLLADQPLLEAYLHRAHYRPAWRRSRK